MFPKGAGSGIRSPPRFMKACDPRQVELAYQEGSVITVDNSISVFAGLCKANADYERTILPIIINHLQKCKPREVPQHAERAAICFNNKNAEEFINVLEKRKSDLSTSQQTRINKLIKKLNTLRT